MDDYIYDVFISYSHRDMEWAKWLQRKLEAFPIPADMADNGKKHLKVFRDQTDLTGTEVNLALNKELASSRNLILICSPKSASSAWVNNEALYFIRGGRKGRIIPFIVEGEPESDDPEIECYPPALRDDPGYHFLGASIQELGKNKAFLKAMAALLDVRFNRLADREKQRRRRNISLIAAVSAVIIAFSSALICRNYVISKQNEVFSYDIYGAALLSITQKDIPEPEDVEFLRISAEAGNTDAIVYLADCYLKGLGTGKDEEAAFMWYLKGAEAGDTVCMTGTANCYLNGWGTEADLEKSFYWDMKAAEAGSPEAISNVAICYEGGLGTEKNEAEALRWYERSAQSGYELGMYNLARCYMSGIGTDPDPEQALVWIKKLAESGNSYGMYNLGLMYQNGLGTETDLEQAYLWYLKAALAGDGDAMREVGRCVEENSGTENAALIWYRLALENGSEEAAEDIKRLES